MNEGRIRMTCWQCEEEFSLFKQYDLTKPERARMEVACPFCAAECVVDLWAGRNEVVDIYNGPGGGVQKIGYTVDLSQLFPTQKPAE